MSELLGGLCLAGDLGLELCPLFSLRVLLMLLGVLALRLLLCLLLRLGQRPLSGGPLRVGELLLFVILWRWWLVG